MLQRKLALTLHQLRHLLETTASPQIRVVPVNDVSCYATVLRPKPRKHTIPDYSTRIRDTDWHLSMKNASRLIVLCVVAGVVWNVAAAWATSPPSRWWIINVSALQSLANNGLPPGIARYFFDNDHTLIIRRPMQTQFSDWRSMNVRTFTSFSELQKAFRKRKIDPTVEAILYDPEAWKFTPKQEQLHLAEYQRKVADLVHRHRLMLISAPATDLVRTLAPGTRPGEKYDAFLRLGIAADAARVSDVYEIQAQGSEMNLEKFHSFVGAAAKQARQANPKGIILAGLSTNPTGHHVTSDQLLAAAKSVIGEVSGYWLNIPSQSPYCPTCGSPRGDIGARFLEQLYQH